MAFPTGRRGLIFDLDGTLADSAGAIVTITLKVLAARGHVVDEAAVRSTVGKPLDQNFAQLMGLPADHPEVRAAMAEYRDGFAEHLEAKGPRMLYPGVAAGLAKLREQGHQLGVATSKTHAAAVRTVEATGIARFFDTVAGHDSVGRGKPEPDLALYVAAEFGISARECVVVGDALGDLQMATAAGMRSIGVSYGVASRDELSGAGAETVVDSFDDVVSLILD